MEIDRFGDMNLKTGRLGFPCVIVMRVRGQRYRWEFSCMMPTPSHLFEP
jgi:hypothetical protein